MKIITATDARARFSDIYNSVRHTGNPVIITNHGDASVVVMRVQDVYPEPTTADLIRMASQSQAFTDIGTDTVVYE